MKNWTIGVRIAAGFAAVLLTVAALGLFAHAQITSIKREADALTQNSLRALYLVGEMRSGAITQYLLLHEHIASNSKAAKAAIENQIAASRARNSNNMGELESLVSTDKQREIIEALKQTRTAYTDARGDVLKVSSIGTDASNKQALLMEEQIVKPIYTKYIAQQEGLVELSKATAEQQGTQIHAAGSDAQTGIEIGLALAIFLGICVTIFIMKSITNPLAAAVRMLERVANGDLTATLHIYAKDEIGHMAASLNDALAKLRSTLQGVADNAANASASSRKMAAAAETIASGSQEQAASLEETAASLEQITATVRQSADNARQASELAVGSRASAEEGQTVVANAITAMAEINESSAKISSIISTIDEIAFQTNLLAVNAAIEAANAGDGGRGFAVIAAEVRQLSTRSASAAREIKALIQDSLLKVAKGTELVTKSGETLQGIVGSVASVTQIVGEIASASAEQSTGVNQVNTAMIQMDQVTQSNSARTEELSATAKSLAEQSERSLELISGFTLL